MAAAAFRNTALGLALAAGACTSMAVEARTLAGTRWQVTAINGHPTPPTDRFKVSFDSKTMSVRFGCNSGGGPYRIEGTRIVTGPMIATQMACAPAADEQPDPMTFERWGFAVANHPMTMRWVSGKRLKLQNSSGSIDLRLLKDRP